MHRALGLETHQVPGDETRSRGREPQSPRGLGVVAGQDTIARAPTSQGDNHKIRKGGLLQPRVCAMILPQVHLRKPCYDFSFL